MTHGEYIDTLLEELDAMKSERDLYEAEAEKLLKIIFSAIESPTYINPWGILEYVKAVYPNRYNKKMGAL